MMKKKKAIEEAAEQTDEMLPEYDFRGGVRGKHHKVYCEGHAVTIHKDDGTIQVQHFTLEDGAVLLESDVRKYFPDSETVNRALRGLITLVPSKPKANVRN